MLRIELGWLDDLVHARRPARLPIVLTRSEVAATLERLHGTTWLMASLLYRAGLRVLECAGLRVKDIDLDRRKILVRDGKERRDRVTLLPESLRTPLASVGRRHGQEEFSWLILCALVLWLKTSRE